jgi:hypothetical protein
MFFSDSFETGYDADGLVDQDISELRKICDEITRALDELCELQSLIQTSQAIRGVGPQLELRNKILQLKSQYPPDASSDVTRSSILSAGKAGDDGPDKEQCTLCKKWFAFDTLEFHQDLCSNAGMQEKVTEHLWQRNSTMSQLHTQRWSPSAVLNIITGDNDISCAGITLKGRRCRWALGRDPKLRARQLLNSMSQKPPSEALGFLPQLARLCLCPRYHQQHAASVVARWTALIELYASSLKKEDARQTHRPLSHGGNTSSMSSNGGVRATGWSGPKLSVDEIIAELNVLSIRQEELRSMLQDADLGDGHKTPKDRLAPTSPSKNTAHLVNQTQLSQSESSRANTPLSGAESDLPLDEPGNSNTAIYND